ncbi:MAG: class I SAM-dependent methyltransferase [Ectothiorhodospira sp.]
MNALEPCPLCTATDGRTLETRGTPYPYRICPRCRLIWLHPDGRPDPAAEKAHYDTHENDPSDPRYRAFLSRLTDPLMRRLPPGARGLDYGAGPGPTVSVMLGEAGFEVTDYDPFYRPDGNALARRYDFITCTETAEHFCDPRAEFRRLDGLLRPGGWLGVMTGFPPEEEKDFGGWPYRRDPTHVCFYGPETMAFIARHFGYALEIPRRNVALFYKPADTGPSSTPA